MPQNLLGQLMKTKEPTGRAWQGQHARRDTIVIGWNLAPSNVRRSRLNLVMLLSLLQRA